MPDPYLDPVLMVGDDLARRGVKASAVAEACQQVSQDIIARRWFHIEGVPVFKADGKPAITVDQFCDQLVKDKPHYLFEEHEVDDADVCFLGVDGKRTLRAAGDFIKKYGEAHYRAVRDQYGCVDDSALLAGKKPGPVGEKPKVDRSNPFSPGGDPARRQERILALIKSSPMSLVASLAKSAGTDIAGRPIPKK
jgi:hypothetical protein